MLRLPRWWWHRPSVQYARYRYPMNGYVCCCIQVKAYVDMRIWMYTCTHTLCVYRERDTHANFGTQSVNHRRCDVEKSQESWKYSKQQENVQVFSVQATLLHEFDCSRFKIHCCCQFYNATLLFSLIWTYVVRSLGGSCEDVKMKKEKNRSASQVNGFFIRIVRRKAMVNGFSIDDSHWILHSMHATSHTCTNFIYRSRKSQNSRNGKRKNMCTEQGTWRTREQQ